jgi:hypothetical protein
LLQSDSSSGAGHFGGVYFLQTEDVGLQSFELGEEHRRTILEHGTAAAHLAQILNIESGNPHK